MNERDTSEWMNESFISQDIYIFTSELNMFYIRHTVYTTSYLTKHKLVNKININIQSISLAPNKIMLICWKMLRESW